MTSDRTLVDVRALQIHPLHNELLSELRRRATSASGLFPELWVAPFDTVTSTMDVARELHGGRALLASVAEPIGATEPRCSIDASRSTTAPIAVVALTQDRGRGRNDRWWNSRAGEGMYATLILGIDRPISDIRGLPLAIGVGVLRGVRELGGDARLKWPNDLWTIDEAGAPTGKLAGVLVESWASGDGQTVSIGIGLNLTPSSDQLPFPRATLEESAGRGVRYELAVTTVLSACCGALEEFLCRGLEVLRTEWEQQSITRNRQVRGIHGGKEIVGRALGLEAHGGLRILPDGADLEIVLHSNEISLVQF
ncbi:MAG: biotin--[acetyl-CoA-carboxylase] ligase [Deltaproteobacteria bacterium]|nr:biotin--[acetyl-CoA-carboxylase] ligase [Deltaproteobacteria bacterium]